MKNIHVIPTDKPSRLYKLSNKLYLDNTPKEYYKKYNIYITSDEEIKEGDWFLWQGYGGEWFKEKCEYMLYEGKKTKHLNCHYKTQFKIILTTDQQLITSGVQAITDEFLEWFVKNPSCERVETKLVEQRSHLSLNDWVDVDENGKFPISIAGAFCYRKIYKIIILKEELKQDTVGKEFYESADKTITVYRQETLEEAKQEQKQHLIDLMRLDEQETIEEAAERTYPINNTGSMFMPTTHESNNNFKQKGFIAGAKSNAAKEYWFEKFQQEQDKKMYSKEEVLEQLNHLMTMPSSKLDKFTDDNGNITMKWFEKFKKK